MQNKEETKRQQILSAFKQDYPLISKNGLKEKAMQFYRNNDFPGLKDEDWRQTNLSPIFKETYAVIKHNETVDIEQFKIKNLNADLLVFVNGFFVKELSDIDTNGLFAGNMQQLSAEYAGIFEKYYESTRLYRENNFTALNTAFAHDGSFIYVKKNHIAGKPVHIMNISTGNEPVLVQLRNLLVTETNAQVEVIETFHTLNGENSFSNMATEVIVGANASVNWLRIQQESESTKHMSHMKVLQQADSRFSGNTITLSGSLVRNYVEVTHQDEGCQTNLFGLYLPRKKQLFDNYTFIRHAKPHCESNQVFKGIVDDDASAVFYGKVLVDKDAQKTNAYQSNRNILLSESAKINSKPQLEIYADDVACSHGSTTGQVDEEALFYLRSRGISKERARAMLLYGFVIEVLDEIENVAVKEYVDQELHKILGE